MLFPWDKYDEIEIRRSNTLQMFITNVCYLKCKGCFARNAMQYGDTFITTEEYRETINHLKDKGGEKVNILGGEPTLHPFLTQLIQINKENSLRTTIYTNGGNIANWNNDSFHKCFDGVTIRLSLNSRKGTSKSLESVKKLGEKKYPLEICFMVSSNTTEEELLLSAIEIERDFNCKVFFISSIRELDNTRKEFFDDTPLTMPVLKYKELVHNFLRDYCGDMEIHISKRGIFESTTKLAENKCRFANYLIGGKIIQCPYDLINLKYQSDYSFGTRNCQQNNTCLMSKIIVRKKNNNI